jgi:hypothetical protein
MPLVKQRADSQPQNQHPQPQNQWQQHALEQHRKIVFQRRFNALLLCGAFGVEFLLMYIVSMPFGTGDGSKPSPVPTTGLTFFFAALMSLMIALYGLARFVESLYLHKEGGVHEAAALAVDPLLSLQLDNVRARKLFWRAIAGHIFLEAYCLLAGFCYFTSNTVRAVHFAAALVAPMTMFYLFTVVYRMSDPVQ